MDGAKATPLRSRRLDLLFNYRVNPTDLKDKLNIEIDGKKVDYTLITLSPDNKISVRIINLKMQDKDYEAKVTIDKGLKPESGNNSTAEPIVTTLSIPSPYVLTIQNVEAEHDGLKESL